MARTPRGFAARSAALRTWCKGELTPVNRPTRDVELVSRQALPLPVLAENRRKTVTTREVDSRTRACELYSEAFGWLQREAVLSVHRFIAASLPDVW